VNRIAAFGPVTLPALLVRASSLFALWLIIAGAQPAEIVVGILATAAAVFVSLRLLPPGHSRISLAGTVKLLCHLLYRSFGAGFDVAWRAINPRLPLRPGFVSFKSSFQPGPKCDAFCTIASMLPGTLPAGFDRDGSVLVHCLDVRQPVTDELDIEKVAFDRAFGGERGT
jgi:multicomponent Na+:H+ antiporter subunit E